MLFQFAFQAICQGHEIVKLCVNCPDRLEAGLNVNGPAIKGCCATWRSRVPAERCGVGSRGISCLGGRKLSRCRMFIGGSCACPGARLSTGPVKWLRVMQKA
jgi:hypothetical protein